MATTTNYSWSTPDDTALVKDGAAAIRSLGTAIDTTVFTNAGAAINKSLVDAAGDLIYGTADNTVARLAIGTASQQLRVNSGATAPEWFTPAAAGGMTLITETVASANSGIDFTSISGSYKQLLLVWSGVYHTADLSSFNIRFNASSSSNYNYLGNAHDSSTVQYDFSNATSIGYDAARPFGYRATSTTAQETVHGRMLIDNYASSTKHKFFYIESGHKDGPGAAYRRAHLHGHFADTTAITQVNIVRVAGSGNLTNISNTSIRLYGLS
jgi:hypothetical protein